MAFKHVNVPKLRSHKIRSKHVSGMLPCPTVGGEDTFAEKRDQKLLTSLAELEGLEVFGQDALEIFWLSGGDEAGMCRD